MKHLRPALFSLLLSTSLLSCAQTKSGIRNIYAYRAVRMHGTIAVDENGKPLMAAADTLHMIYVETDRQGIAWDHAWKDNKTYNITATLVSQIPIEVGREKGSQKNISIRPSKGSQLWLLEFSPAKDVAPPRRINPGAIMLRYKLKNTKFLRIIPHQTELSLPDAV